MSVIINSLFDLLRIASASTWSRCTPLTSTFPAFLPSYKIRKNRLRSYCNSLLYQMCSTLQWLLLTEFQGYLCFIAFAFQLFGRFTLLDLNARCLFLHLCRNATVTCSAQNTPTCFLLWDYSTGIIIASFISEKRQSVNKRYNESTNNGNACNQ